MAFKRSRKSLTLLVARIEDNIVAESDWIACRSVSTWEGRSKDCGKFSSSASIDNWKFSG